MRFCIRFGLFAYRHLFDKGDKKVLNVRNTIKKTIVSTDMSPRWGLEYSVRFVVKSLAFSHIYVFLFFRILSKTPLINLGESGVL